MSDMLTGEQREHWHGGVHRPGPGFPPSGPRRYIGVRRRPRAWSPLTLLGPAAAVAVAAAAGALYLSDIGRPSAPDSAQVVQLPGVCSGPQCNAAPAGTVQLPRIAAVPSSTGRSGGSGGGSMPPAAATQPLSRGRSPSPTVSPSPSTSTAPIPLDSLIPVLQSPDPCPMPTKHGKGRPSKGPDGDR